MEAVVLLGLLGIGYLKNKEDNNKNPINNSINNDIQNPNGDNIYNSEHYKETQNIIKELSENKHNESFREDSNVFNNKKIKHTNNNVEGIENFSNSIYSSSSGEYINPNDFLTNDQGIRAQPFLRKETGSIDLNDTRQLDRHQGDNRMKGSKKELAPFFQWEKNNNVFGNQFGEYIGDKSRYNESTNKNNELPFEQERVSHIDTKSDINREIKQIIADKTNIDNLRSKNDPKLTYKGRIISGKSTNENRGNIGEVNKYDPETFYENTEDRYFKTTGAFLKQSENPKHLLKDTYRTSLNEQPIGPVSANYSTGEKRSKYRKPLKIQLGTDPIRNAGASEYAADADFSRSGYRSIPNERDVTGQRTYESNLNSINQSTTRVQDNIKHTIRESTETTRHTGNLNNTVVNQRTGLQDGAKVTKKQTTIDSKNNGYISGGYNKLTEGYESPELTTKDTTLNEYTGGAKSSGYTNEMSTMNYRNAETNPNKEIISQGRAPTLSNTKVTTGGDYFDIDIKKLESDYINQHENISNKVYSSGPDQGQYELTTMKDKLNDSSIMDRIDKDLLDPFRNNPYTQPLSSY
tara:strand:- start:1007 stop:2740 length:1734 start_codon:yes stop_codon:yes gene_type:complete